jgi:2-C-methyl-D-erythritol 4-phosphate cytidylyltransferase
MRNIAVILAGGVGNRMGDNIPKQFFKVAGKTVMEHTVAVFERNSLIDEIAIVIHPSFVSVVEDMIISNEWAKVKKILKGGKERYESSLAAINAYTGGADCNLIFHDAVRPLVSERIINNIIEALKKYNAVDVAIPATDTIIKVDSSGNYIRNIPNRNFLRRGQTPQGFRLSTIRMAYQEALKDSDFVSSDDCGIVVKYLPDEIVYVVRGEESNIKLTYREDAYLLDKLFQLKTMSLTGNNDLNLLKDKTIVVFGGNSGIGAEIIKIANNNGAKAFSFSRSATNTDIADKKAVKQALEYAYSQTGCIDYVVNSAAILNREPLINMSDETIERMIATNYSGMVNVAVESYRYLKQSKGHLLLYTSSSYTRGRAFYSIYSSTKAAVVNFAQALAQEWERAEIRVNVINPQRTKTPMRTQNFGNEPDESLLSAALVAEISVQTLLSNFTGQIIDINKSNNCLV